ncbi:MAG: dTDP-4-dehydrorhamnose 3,5-epimerase [Candidatus Omnitrophica bacterium]|nr:dTDP-4-dehydrorhamnose 3,5-epimerase [Candidatus Omnitrophota bacterium]
MKFTKTPIEKVYLLEIEKIEDERGFFARSWCAEEFEKRGLNGKIAQCSISFNKKKGTLRGMHYQVPPHEEAKIIRCTMGAIYDVIIDIRPDSPTFRKWYAAELSADNRRMIYAPEGVAHGYVTLKDDCEIFYQISELYHPECAKGVRWDDPAFGVKWPSGKKIINDRDAGYPDIEL